MDQAPNVHVLEVAVSRDYMLVEVFFKITSSTKRYIGGQIEVTRVRQESQRSDGMFSDRSRLIYLRYL
jgi:hypothetical protein